MNLYPASIVQSLPPFTAPCPTIPTNTSFPLISPSDVENEILKLRKPSTCFLDIPLDLIKACSDKIVLFETLFETFDVSVTKLVILFILIWGILTGHNG